MIVYFQQGQRNKENFAVVQNSETATHFQENGGKILSIDQLTLNAEKPLPLPALNFDDDDDKKKAAPAKDDSSSLPLPKL